MIEARVVADHVEFTHTWTNRLTFNLNFHPQSWQIEVPAVPWFRTNKSAHHLSICNPEYGQTQLKKKNSATRVVLEVARLITPTVASRSALVLASMHCGYV